MLAIFGCFVENKVLNLFALSVFLLSVKTIDLCHLTVLTAQCHLTVRTSQCPHLGSAVGLVTSTTYLFLYSSTSALLYQSCASFLASQLNRTWHVLCRDMPGHCRKGVLMCTAGCIVPCWFGTDSSFGGGVGAGFSTGIPWSVSQGRMIVCQCSSWVMTVVFLCTFADK